MSLLPLHMLILLDCRPLQYAGPDSEKNHLIFSVVASFAREKQVKWILLVDHTWRPGSLPGLDEEGVQIQRALPGRAAWKLWYDWQIPRLVKKHRPDWVMLTGGIAAARMSAPQCIWMPVFANPKEQKKDIPLYAGRLAETLRRAESIFCFSEKDRAWLAGRTPAGVERVGLIRPAPSVSATPLSAAERERIKREYAQGKEFFFGDVIAAGEEEVVYMLKAFSLFKKRQLSNMQLVMAGIPRESVKERLETYKYRQDIHWCSASAARDDRLTAAAYAALFLCKDDLLGTSVLDAWKAGVPVLVTGGSRLAEMAGDAALAAGDPTVLAGHMMSVYKDEALRGRLIEKGFVRLPEFAPGHMLAKVWRVIDRAYGIIK